MAVKLTEEPDNDPLSSEHEDCASVFRCRITMFARDGTIVEKTTWSRRERLSCPCMRRDPIEDSRESGIDIPEITCDAPQDGGAYRAEPICGKESACEGWVTYYVIEGWRMVRLDDAEVQRIGAVQKERRKLKVPTR